MQEPKYLINDFNAFVINIESQPLPTKVHPLMFSCSRSGKAAFWFNPKILFIAEALDCHTDKQAVSWKSLSSIHVSCLRNFPSKHL